VPTGFTTICLPTDLHAALADMKVHPRQAYHEVIRQLLPPMQVLGPDERGR
jgi:hypothetical protein